MSALPASIDRKPGFLQGILLLLPITLSVMGVSLLTAVIPLMYEHFKDIPNHEYLIQGGIMTMPSLWILLFSPFAGWLADRFGRRNLLVVSMVIYAIVGIAPTFLDNLYAIIFSRMLVGICESILMTVSTTMISDYFHGKSRERWLAGQTATASTSALIIIPLGGQLAADFGWRGPFYLYLYSIILVIGILAFIWEPRSEDKVSAQAAHGVLPADQVPSNVPVAFPWARILSLCALTVVASVMFYSIITQNGVALAQLGVTDPAASGRLTMMVSVGVPVGTFVYWGASKLRIGWLVCLDFLLIGIGFWGMGRATNPTSYVEFGFINQVGCGLVLPTLLVWTTRGLAFEIRGRGNGMWQGAFAIGQFLSGMLLVLLGKELGGLLPAFSALSVICFVFAAGAVIGALTSSSSTTPATTTAL